jgi:hypothetical protein
MNNRRSFLEKSGHACLGALALGAASIGATAQNNQSQPTIAPETPTRQKFLLVGLVGSENPTRANFPFVWAAALKQAGNDVQIDLVGDATVIMRTVVANNVHPVGWPPLSEALAKVVDLKIPIFV